VSRIEHGHIESFSVACLVRVAAALDIRLDLVPRWRGGELDRVLNKGHSALHESVARSFSRRPGWTLAPEVSFSVYGERGVIDTLAWHAATRALLVIELKTAIVDVQELVGTLDRKRRLARGIARERGWSATSVGCWVIVAGSRTNRRRIDTHRTMLRAALPADGRAIAAWLLRPAGTVAALSMWPDLRPRNSRPPPGHLPGVPSRPAGRARSWG
jgi:hypothetical protein